MREENAEFPFKLEDKTRAFQIDGKSGWLTVRDQSQLDREKMSQINLKVYADEKVRNVAFGTMKSYAMVEVHLLDANDANRNLQYTHMQCFHYQICNIKIVSIMISSNIHPIKFIQVSSNNRFRNWVCCWSGMFQNNKCHAIFVSLKISFTRI